MGTLCRPCHKVGYGHPKVMIYINFVELLPLMLHARFQNRRSSGSGEKYFYSKVFAIYSHGGDLGHVTLTFYINFHSHIPRILHTKFGFDWSSGY